MKRLFIPLFVLVLALTGCAELLEPPAYSIETDSSGKADPPIWVPPDAPVDQSDDGPAFDPTPDTDGADHSHDWGTEAEAAGHTLCEITDPAHPWYESGKRTSCEVCGALCDGQAAKQADKAQQVAP